MTDLLKELPSIAEGLPQILGALISLWLLFKVYKVGSAFTRVIKKAPARYAGFVGLLTTLAGAPYAVTELWGISPGLSIGVGLSSTMVAIASASMASMATRTSIPVDLEDCIQLATEIDEMAVGPNRARCSELLKKLKEV